MFKDGQQTVKKANIFYQEIFGYTPLVLTPNCPLPSSRPSVSSDLSISHASSTDIAQYSNTAQYS